MKCSKLKMMTSQPQVDQLISSYIIELYLDPFWNHQLFWTACFQNKSHFFEFVIVLLIWQANNKAENITKAYDTSRKNDKYDILYTWISVFWKSRSFIKNVSTNKNWLIDCN